MSGRWVVCRTKPLRENWAAINVRRQGRLYYLPQYFDRQRKRRVALFPSYLFVLIRSGDTPDFLRNTYGVAALIYAAGEVASVDRTVIRELKHRENDHGVVVLPEQKLQDEFASYKPGQSILRVVDGPFVGLSGLYDGMAPHSRIRVLLELIGGKVPVTMERSSLELVA